MAISKDEEDDIEIKELLMENRIILLDREIVDTVHADIVARLIILNSKDTTRKKPIYLLINSPGGETYPTLGLIDMIQTSPCPVYTICTGQAMSGAAMILAAGYKRFSVKNATIMLHSHWSEYVGLNHHQMMNEAKESVRLYNLCVDILIEKTKLTKKKIESLLAKDYWMGTKEAKELNIIDEIGFDLYSIYKK